MSELANGTRMLFAYSPIRLAFWHQVPPTPMKRFGHSPVHFAGSLIRSFASSHVRFSPHHPPHPHKQNEHRPTGVGGQQIWTRQTTVRLFFCSHVRLFSCSLSSQAVQQENGETANWRNGELAKRRIGETANWRNGELAKRRIGETANWRNGELAKRRIGETANWRNGEIVSVFKKFHEKRKAAPCYLPTLRPSTTTRKVLLGH